MTGNLKAEARTRPQSAPIVQKAPSVAASIASQDGSESSRKSWAPRYLRATQASSARTKKEEDAARLQEDKLKRAISGAGFISSTSLLKPTASTMSRTTSARDTTFSAILRSSSRLYASQQLNMSTGSTKTDASTPRTTKTEPFRLRTELRTSNAGEKPLSTEEMQMKRALEEATKMIRYKPVPKCVYEAPKSPVTPTRDNPKPPEFKEFKLESVERHQRCQQELQKKIEREKKKEQDGMSRFKAREFNAAELKPITVEFKKIPPTKGESPKFATEERMQYHHDVVSPRRKAKDEADKAQKEAEETARLESEKIKPISPMSPFKAQPMPDFSAPFKPDLTNVVATTKTEEFDFETDKRKGKIDTRRSDSEEISGKFLFSGDGYLDRFAGSLRSSMSSPAKKSALNSSTSPRKDLLSTSMSRSTTSVH